MKKILLTALALLFINCLMAAEAHAKKLTTKEITECYMGTYGREPTSDEMNYWLNSNASIWTFSSNLKEFLDKPEGAQELQMMITRLYKTSFGREPTSAELAHWQTVVKNPVLPLPPNSPDLFRSAIYGALTEYMSRWLKTAEARTERLGVANRSTYHVFGRYPSGEELEVLLAVVERDGMSYEKMVKAHTDWLLGSTPQQVKELRETIRRAYSAAHKPPPTEDQYKYWLGRMYGDKLNFEALAYLVKYIKI